MIRTILWALALSATAATAQNATTPGQDDCKNDDDDCTAAVINGQDAITAAKAEGVTGFVPLIAPALGSLAAAAGVAAAVGGGNGAANSTVSTNN